ncbi:Gfo/Idh/MocA family protein [Aquamicrobium zhengzhouense]|uniref:Gfo/Idh/MocA family oxidoreductase n=1 Tax=Aquamicrobium zhengzhouense TaxID=2781738 RepID=A0ABS0SEN4_9HYPH|nr:Gfo/Idh/MocA family oxidoreductase [Aquamicrobium zhengzhouense]MBI1621755.1 Gfo/Idh/MocA family oxidoreductase [Aquamicrobium zhengzhouense]
MASVGIGLIGTGFMGKCHALAYGAVRAVFGDVPTPRLELLCEMPRDKAEAMADQFGFARVTDDWQNVVSDPAVDIVCITTPNKLHAQIAIAALEAGKHVHCEKPMALTLEDAEAMAAAARGSAGKTIVGYNYIRNPAFQHVRKLIEEGAIGRPIHFRGFVDEDYQADPDLPWTWRATKAEAGLGALGDLGCHMISMAVELMGKVRSVIGDVRTVHATRPSAEDGMHRPVENEDIASAILEFDNGVQGVFSTSRSAWGRKNYMAVEVHGTQGMICFDQERMNELRLYQNSGGNTQGFRTILTGPSHDPYGHFVPAPGHQLGFNDLKTIEAASFLRAIADKADAYPSFADALHFERVIHAIAASYGNRISI